MERPALFALPRIATSFAHVGIVTLTLPVIVLGGAGDDAKGLHLGGVTAAASILSLAVLYGAGSMSDRAASSDHRRRYVVYSLVAMLAPLAVLLAGGPYPWMLAAILLLVVSRSVCDATHLPLLASEQDGRPAGRVTAFFSLYYVLGAAAGAMAFERGVANVVGITVTVVALAGFLGSVPGPQRLDPGPRLQSSSPLGALLQRNVILLMGARVLFLAATFIVSTFFVFLVRDVLRPPDFDRAAARLFATALAGGVVFALPAGRLVDRFGDRRVLLAAGAALGVAIAGFVIAGPQGQGIAVACMVLYGASLAAVMTSGLALLLAVVPAPHVAGRLMAIASGTIVLSQALASAAGAVLLDPLNRVRAGLGYAALAGVAELFILSGGLLIALMEPRTLPSPQRHQRR